MHDQPPRRSAQLSSDVFLKAGQLDKIAVGLLAEVEAVCVDDKLQRAGGHPEIEQADARNVGRIGERLECRDGRRAALRVRAQTLDDPSDLVAAGALVVEKPHGVALGSAELGDVLLK